MKIISSARYNNFLKLEKKFKSTIDEEIKRMDEMDDDKQIQFERMMSTERRVIQASLEDKYADAINLEKENKTLKDNIISLKKKLNILTMKTK